MPKFRKKPVVVDAILLTGSSVNLREVHKFMTGRYPDTDSFVAGEKWEDYVSIVNKKGLKIDTLEGVMTASIGDYIIRGINYELYPCKPDIFDKTYELVD